MSGESPVLSVIVPSLDGTVPQSLREQVTGRTDCELIVVKGVSPVGKARNEGLLRAKGDYIAWVDADDEVTDGWWQRIREKMGDGPDVMVLDYETEEGRRIVWRESGRGLLADLVANRLTGACWLFVTRRTLWEGLRFDERDAVSEDYRLMPEVVARAASWTRLGVCYHYAINPKSLTQDRRNVAHALARFHAGLERAARWRGTELEGIAFAESCREAGWMIEWYVKAPEIVGYLDEQFLRAWRCPELAWHWKIKLLLFRCRLVGVLKPMYAVLWALRRMIG